MFLVDTSIWIAFFRRQDPLPLDELIPFDAVVTCLPVIQEVLQGFRDERAYHLAREAMAALPIVESPLNAIVFDEAINLFRAARRQGITVRSSTDCLIAACALRNDLTVLHADRDFTALSTIVPLKQQLIS